VQNNEPDRIADLLEEAADVLEQREANEFFDKARTIARRLDNET
jgi:hypothetical protein